MSQLHVGCLYEIFEYLNDDRSTLHSCILVNRLWCEVSVKIFWRNGCDYSVSNFNTLVSCLPNESKEILSKNGITILTKTTKFPTFNYASFCKVLSINHVRCKVEELLKNEQTISPQILEDNTNIVVQEICKMFMNQISSLEKLILIRTPTFIHYPETKDCLKNLSELHCYSNISSKTFYQLSQICQNISLLDISQKSPFISDGLADLVSVQKNLKHFILTQYFNDTISSLIKRLPNTLIKLNLRDFNFISLLFITEFSNLQELELSFEYKEDFIDFDKLSYASFPQLQILKFQYLRPNNEALVRFLENNGKNLKELYVGVALGYNNSNNSLNSAISKFCTNIRKFSGGFKNNELELIFKSCKYLKSIEIFCGDYLLNEKEALDEVVNYSHKNVTEIILHYYYSHIQTAELLPNELESFIVRWASSVPSVPQRSLSFVIVTNDYCGWGLTNEENMKIIKKYYDLGVIKDFKIRDYDYYDEFD
ncbi:hypothetical protein RclHR1_07730003 [Rhizophagus clarus]|uniref:F-box domain-containing protein n=1 Tax=Rhizophagus clarus TaxID=94130 RepID=A0A2Z6SD25_9GLOM|nr:hypothetical protein RclHR1_07730003 [Rhizophagus clarus]GES74608.1 hypothetical protein GLOIN_2v1876445 [Rhizophagus clarus]